MTFEEFKRRYENKDNTLLPGSFTDRVGASLAIQVHSTGARPMFTLDKRTYKPENYHERFDTHFKTRILNRHPNESDESYNWRLSVYSPIAKEIFDRFLNFAKGSILQPNNWAISADEKTTEYLSTYSITNCIIEGLEHVLNNPKGFMAVICPGYDGLTTTALKPEIVCVAPDQVLMIDSDSVAFKHNGNIYYLSLTDQVEWIEGRALMVLPHKNGVVPLWDIENNFTQPFVTWADQLARNFSDDEMMTKQYSYPIKQVVQAQCGTCTGTGKVTKEDEHKKFILKTCDDCHGSGVMSINPGEHITITEEKLMKMGLSSMPDYARFITPDIGIPEYHLKRWQVFYERAEKALYLNKKINGTESGDAKKEDRRDQYVQMATISGFLFRNIEKGLKLISAYLNYNGSSGRYEAGEIIVYPPKQFDLMTDPDMVEELINIQGKTDDSMILGESQYTITSKLYRDDKVQARINDILYEIDPLYGVSHNMLQKKYLSGIFSDREKTIHEKGYFILRKIARSMMPEVFIEANTEAIMTRFDQELTQYIPETIYTMQ